MMELKGVAYRPRLSGATLQLRYSLHIVQTPTIPNPTILPSALRDVAQVLVFAKGGRLNVALSATVLRTELGLRH